MDVKESEVWEYTQIVDLFRIRFLGSERTFLNMCQKVTGP